MEIIWTGIWSRPANVTFIPGSIDYVPDVGAVVHAHPFSAVACTIAGQDILPVGHWGTVFAPKVPVYPSSEQIESQEMGEDIARVMGDAPRGPAVPPRGGLRGEVSGTGPSP